MSDEAQLWATARRVCTKAELAVLEERERLANAGADHGYRSVARSLDLSWTTVRDRMRRAENRIRRAMHEAER